MAYMFTMAMCPRTSKALSDITAKWSQNQHQHSLSQLCQHCCVWGQTQSELTSRLQCLCASCLISTPRVLWRCPFSPRITLKSPLSTCQVTPEVGTSASQDQCVVREYVGVCVCLSSCVSVCVYLKHIMSDSLYRSNFILKIHISRDYESVGVFMWAFLSLHPIKICG
jgi:hypothetical protein